MKLLKTRYGFWEINWEWRRNYSFVSFSRFVFAMLFIPSFIVLSGYFCLTQFADSSHSLNFDKFRDTAPLSSPILNNCGSPASAWVTCRIYPFRRHILTMWITGPAISHLTPPCSRLCSSFSLLGSLKSPFRWAPIGILHCSIRLRPI